MALGHRAVLLREFERVAALTDAAYVRLMNGDSPRDEAVYKEWVTVLLRYHDALERVAGKGDGTKSPRPMKGEAT